MMVKLVTIGGKLVQPTEVKKDELEIGPVELLNELCRKCFLIRRHYISSISDQAPFDKERANQIMEIMITKGTNDPKAFALGQSLKMNWHKFKDL